MKASGVKNLGKVARVDRKFPGRRRAALGIWGLVAGSAVLLSGCIEQTAMVRPGITYGRYEADRTSCMAKTVREIPNNTQIGWAPYVGIYSVDVNSGVKRKVYEQCMRSKGYRRAELPACDAETIKVAQSAIRSDSIQRMKLGQPSEMCWFIDREGEERLFTRLNDT